MKTPLSFPYTKALACCALVWASTAGAVDLWQAGVGGDDWDDIGTLSGLSIDDGVLIPAAVNPATNALRAIKQRGGEIRSPQDSRADLTSLLTDGNNETSWRVTRERRPDGTSMEIDLGAVLPINRVRIIGNQEDFLRAYDMLIHDGNPNQLRSNRPIAYINQVSSEPEQEEPVIDVEFPLQFVRFIRVVSRSTIEFAIEEVEVFGDGFAPSGIFTSQVIDLGDPANYGTIQLLSQTDELTEVVLQTRTGSVPDPRIFYRKTDVFQGEERSEEPIFPIGFPEAEETYEDLFNSDKGRIEDNIEEWSPWSSPYLDPQGLFLSPGNRRYVQFRLIFSSDDARAGARVESFGFEHSTPTLGEELVAEISPANVVLGETHRFDYFVRAEFGAGNPGFDRVEITTPFRAALREVELDGVAVPFEVEETERTLAVRLTEDRVQTSGQVLRIGFEALVTVYGTTFFARARDTASGELPQDIIAGDATAASGSDRLSIQGRLRSELVLDLETRPPVFTPNGDGANDGVAISYILLRALDPVPVELTVYDLSGRPVRRLQQSDELNGPQEVIWDGRDEADRLVAPGIYLLRLSVQTDTGDDTQARLIGVAY